MRRIKYFALVFALLLCLSLGACAKVPPAENQEVVPSKEYLELDGTWVSEDGWVIFLDAVANRYFLQAPSGRVGAGNYLPVESEPVVKFDGVSYLMKKDGDRLTFTSKGTPNGESLQGIVFLRGEARLMNNSRTKLQGAWISDAGNRLSLDFDGMAYEYQAGSQTLSGEIRDDDNGKGLYLDVNGSAVYFIVAQGHESFVLEGGTPVGITEGVYKKDESAASLAPYKSWMDTWLLQGEIVGTRLILRGTGTWEQLDGQGNPVASGSLKADEAYGGGLGLLNENGALVGVVTLGAEDQLLFDSDPANAENPTEYYLREKNAE